MSTLPILPDIIQTAIWETHGVYLYIYKLMIEVIFGVVNLPIQPNDSICDFIYLSTF